jgi:hypothetical protein
LEQHSLPSVEVAAEAMKEARKTGIQADLVAVVLINQAQPILVLVVQELQDKGLLVEIHAAVAVAKSLAAAAAVLAVLVLVVPQVVAVVVVTDPITLELEEMDYRTQLVELLFGTPEEVEEEVLEVVVETVLTFKQPMVLEVDKQATVVVDNVKWCQVISKQKMAAQVLLSFDTQEHQLQQEEQSLKWAVLPFILSQVRELLLTQHP